jgi:hypothetical protein
MPLPNIARNIFVIPSRGVLDWRQRRCDAKRHSPPPIQQTGDCKVMAEPRQIEPSETEEQRSISISHIVHTIRAYMPVIAISLAAVTVGSVILVLALYLFGPSQKITTQQFRLDFEGATDGRYPNGLKFSSSEIVSTPIVLAVFKGNHLEQFTTFEEYSRSVFVLESNRAYDLLAAEYDARLSDPRLSSVDRDRLQKEWQSKVSAIAKNDYSISYIRPWRSSTIPETLVRKTLGEILSRWAEYAKREKHVLLYQTAVLSPEILNVTPSSSSDDDYILLVQILRSKMTHIIANIDVLYDVPGSELARTRDGMSLAEIRLHLVEIIRFRLEPLNGLIRSSGLIKNPPLTARFVESQLAYDQRELKSAQDYADSIRESLAIYTLNRRGLDSQNGESAKSAGQKQPGSETVMVTDSFIDRLVSLTGQSADLTYRQKLITDFRKASDGIVPAQMAVAYDQELLSMLKNAGSATSPQNAAQVSAEITGTLENVRKLVSRVNEIYEILSANLNASTELFTLTAPPTTHTERTRGLYQLTMYGVLLILASLPVIIVLCLMHARVREEEVSEGYIAPGETP